MSSPQLRLFTLASKRCKDVSQFVEDIHRLLLVLTPFLIWLVLSPITRAQTLGYQLSDNHSAAREAVIFAKAVFKHSNEVAANLGADAANLTKFISINGDFSGMSAHVQWANLIAEKQGIQGIELLKNGWFGIYLLEALAKDGFIIVKTNGNHDGMDFHDKAIFLEQEMYLKRAIRGLAQSDDPKLQQLAEMNRSYGLLMGNVEVTDDVKALGLFTEFRDITTLDGNVYRFIGGVLDRYFNKVYGHYIADEGQEADENRHIFHRRIEELDRFIARMVSRAKNEGVAKLVFQIHENYDKLQPIIERYKNQFDGLDTVVFQAGHDHKDRVIEIPESQARGPTFLTDSGSNYNAVVLAFNEKGHISGGPLGLEADAPHLFPVSNRPRRGFGGTHVYQSQKEYVGDYQLPADSATGQLIERLQREIDQADAWLNATHSRHGKTVFTGFIPQTKETLKRPSERPLLGDMWAGAFQRSGQRQVLNQRNRIPQQLQDLPVIGMVNSSSYRSDYPFGEPGQLVPLTNEMLIRTTVMDKASIVLLTGAQLKALYRTARNFRTTQENAYTPQISKNVRVKDAQSHVVYGITVPNYQLFLQEEGQEQRRPIHDSELVWVVMDGFFFRNEMNLAEFRQYFGEYNPQTREYSSVLIWDSSDPFHPTVPSDPKKFTPIELRYADPEVGTISAIALTEFVDEFHARRSFFDKTLPRQSGELVNLSSQFNRGFQRSGVNRSAAARDLNGGTDLNCRTILDE